MPYPNSQTPVTMRLNQLFSNPSAIRAQALTDLRNWSIPLSALASDPNYPYRVVQGIYGTAHVAAWPIDQQMLLRFVMIRALEADPPIPMTFDWQTAPSTSIDIVYFRQPRQVGVTFRSPPAYPPYWGA